MKNSKFLDNFYLAEQLKLGKEEAYNFLMESFYDKLCSYAYALIKNHSKAEDIVQNVFADVFVNRKQINPGYSIKGYLYKSVYNEFIDQYRKNKPIIYLEKKYFEALDLFVEKEYDDLDTLIKKVDEEINNLPTKCKQIFLLNKKEGLTHVEISEYLNISTKTIEGHITRAFKILNEKLGPKMEALLFLLFDFKTKTAVAH
ncbi:RNA polymerase sigma factor [Seonamhaeicola marinus]|uniref:Sigma-70 family RNA polymerase sigma factor n=1 Tax=Seonamhaeicola marinus TaxID=1912246 RepID=A0A5D0HX95_9FLAO|nr:sigma-70 family RNA polymerase sigma factor [Seonamhaeicola marinus]TYA74767.1 sigma-70 family RNA polymerase sigma factor [Seonamhaeicola marinus]